MSSLHNTQTSVKSPENKAGSVGHYYLDHPLLDNSDQLFSGITLAQLKEVAVTSLNVAGLENESREVAACGEGFIVYKCQQCYKYPARVFHCDQRLCPVCYYRQLIRFFRRHRGSLKDIAPITVITVNCGGWTAESLKAGLAEAKEQHKIMIESLLLLSGGVYHIEIKYEGENQLNWIKYHYLIDGGQNWVLFFDLALAGNAGVEKYKQFSNYRSAERYFLRECCKYPYSICLDPTRIQWFMTLLKRQKLIQGFGNLYRVTGGRMKVGGDRHEFICPFCGGKCQLLVPIPIENVFWNYEQRCYEYRARDRDS